MDVEARLTELCEEVKVLGLFKINIYQVIWVDSVSYSKYCIQENLMIYPSSNGWS